MLSNVMKTVLVILLTCVILGCVSGNHVLAALSQGEVKKEKMTTTFYVSPDGDDENPGTMDAPWRTVDYASSRARPGDTVMLMPGEYSGLLRPAHSGTPEAPIVFKAMNRRTARLVGNASGSTHVVELADVEYIHLEGLHVQPKSPQGRWFLVQRANNIRIDDVLMEKASGSMPFHINESQHIYVRDSVIREYIGGNMARVSHSKWILFEGNSISRTGHSPLQFYPPGSNQYVVVRANVFHPAWGRAFEFFGTKDLLFEGNIVSNAYDGGRSASSNAKILSQNGIFRFNRIYRNHGGPISASPENDWMFWGIRLYHNVFDDNLDYGLATNAGHANVHDVTYVNNVFSRNDRYGSDWQISFSGTLRPVLTEDGQYVSRIKFFNNIVFSSNSDAAATIGFGGQALDLHTTESELWSRASLATRSILFFGNKQVDPRFVNVLNYDHGLAPESSLRDSGAFLTRAVGAGEGTVISVEDATFFYDGFGLQGEVGDLIAVGSPDNIARVVRVDRSKNQLMLDRRVQWEAGAAVSLPWGGIAPDIGAFEYGAVGRPSVYVTATPFAAEPGETVLLNAVLLNVDDPVEIRWQLGDGTIAYGTQLTHRYSEEYDYPIRLRVMTSSGEVVRGVGYVVVERRRAVHEPLVFSTFDTDDDEWWWRWKSYRPTPTDWARELDPRTGNGILRISNPGGGTMPLKLAPVGWDIDQYPWIYLRYRVTPGTPVGFFLGGFRGSGGERRMWIAATPDGRKGRAGRTIPYELIDDGEWHTLVMDARVIRSAYPEVQVLRRFGAETMGGSRFGDTYVLDEFALLPSESFEHDRWREKLASMQQGHVDIMSPVEGGLVRGELTIVPAVVSYPGPLDGGQWGGDSYIDISIDGRSIATTDNARAVSDVRVDTTQLLDGQHVLTVKYTDERGMEITRQVTFTVRNWRVMTDEFKPPETWQFFGETMITDHRRTVDESDGWMYAVDLEAPEFDQVAGIVKTTDDEEFLMWEAPDLRSFEIVLYAKESLNIASTLRTMVDIDGGQWVEVPYIVAESGEVTEERTADQEGGNADGAWTKYVVSGQGPDGAEVKAFKIHVGTEAPAFQIRIEKVSLVIRDL